MTLTLDEYQKLAQRTAGAGCESPEKRLAVAGLGVAGEAGEVAEIFKKAIGHGHKLDKEVAKDELGDVMWYVAEAASALGLTLGEIGEANIEKLRKRYPDGFSQKRSRNRGESN